MDQPVQQVTSAESAGPPWKRVALLAFVLCALLVVGYTSPLREYVGDLGKLSERIRSFGIWAPLIFTLLIAVLVAVGFPRLILCAVSGAAFGFGWGLLYAQVGTLAGNYAVFVVARLGGSERMAEYLARKTARMNGLVKAEGLRGVLLARQLPVPSLAINLACALLGVRQRDFLIGTLLGQLPEAVPCTLIGAGVLKASFTGSAGVISLAVIAAVVSWAVVQRWLRWNKA
jgi:uncharacterized membrane protein YdjX (TVP38/TMEM64 family)